MVRLLFSVLIPLLLIALPTQALDTSTGVGLQDRALFQETVDYTLTNQSGGDFRGQNLANTSFAGAVGRGADFRDANLHGAILTQGAFCVPTPSITHPANENEGIVERKLYKSETKCFR